MGGIMGEDAQGRGHLDSATRSKHAKARKHTHISAIDPAPLTGFVDMNQMNFDPGLPASQGLYDPSFERDACGVGFIADLKNRKSH